MKRINGVYREGGNMGNGKLGKGGGVLCHMDLREGRIS